MIFRAANSADAAPISALIRSLANDSLVNADGTGAEVFWQSMSPTAIASYIANPRYRYVVAMSGSELAGVIAIRDSSHLTALFVAPHHQRQGLATRLWGMASNQARQTGNQGLYTVNSALGALAVYQRFGFVAVGDVKQENGIRFQPMVLRMKNKPEFIFVYGTLRKDTATLMSHLLAQHCELHRMGSMCGVLYEVAGYPGAVQSNDEADRVVGEVH
ncbi:MAG: GNAT family N-acetyltransferase, partial [Pseudomonadota bacterium]